MSYTLIEIENNVKIVIGIEKEYVLEDIKKFLKNKLVLTHTIKGYFNGIEMLSAKLVYFLQEKENKEELPASIWLYGANQEVDCNDFISIRLGKQIILTQEDRKKFDKQNIDFDIWGNLHGAYTILIDDISNIDDIELYKNIFCEELSKNYINL